jgi:hypothetical protein
MPVAGRAQRPSRPTMLAAHSDQRDQSTSDWATVHLTSRIVCSDPSDSRGPTGGVAQPNQIGRKNLKCCTSRKFAARRDRGESTVDPRNVRRMEVISFNNCVLLLLQ